MNNNYDASFRVEILAGGFILEYPETDASGGFVWKREIFTAQPKLMKRVKEVLEVWSLVGKDKA
jgi:hypothetical protein